MLGAQLTMNVQPYFHSRWSDCGECHNTPAMAYNASNVNAIITLDGNETEDFWSDVGNTMYAPASPLNGPGDGEHFALIRARISQNDTHLFVSVRVPSDDGKVNGSDVRAGVDRDMFAMIWNIDHDDMVQDWWGNMKSNEEGKSLDQVVWIPKASETGTIDDAEGLNGVEGKFYDEAYTDVGKTTDDTNDWSGAAIFTTSHGHTDYYIEMTRPLMTADSKEDVQFQYDGYYQFMMAFWNQTKGINHWVTYEQYVWVAGVDGVNPADISIVTETTTAAAPAAVTETTTKTESPFNGLFAMFGLFSVGLAVALRRRR